MFMVALTSFGQGSWGFITPGATNVLVDNLTGITNVSQIVSTNLSTVFTDPFGGFDGIITNSQEVVVDVTPPRVQAVTKFKFLSQIETGTNPPSAAATTFLGFDMFRNLSRLQQGGLEPWAGVGYFPADPGQQIYAQITPALAGLYLVEITPQYPFILGTNRLVGPVTLIEGTNSIRLNMVCSTNQFPNMKTYSVKWDGNSTLLASSAVVLIETVDVLEARLLIRYDTSGDVFLEFPSGYALQGSDNPDGPWVTADREPYQTPYYIRADRAKRFYRLVIDELSNTGGSGVRLMLAADAPVESYKAKPRLVYKQEKGAECMMRLMKRPRK